MPRILEMVRISDGSGRERMGVVLDVPPPGLPQPQIMLVTETELTAITERAVKRAIEAVEESHDRHVDQLDECYMLLREIVASDQPTTFFATRIRKILGLETN
jgi:hypothetical protein